MLTRRRSCSGLQGARYGAALSHRGSRDNPAPHSPGAARRALRHSASAGAGPLPHGCQWRRPHQGDTCANGSAPTAATTLSPSGYAPPGPTGLTSHLFRLGVTETELVDNGLACGTDRGHLIDAFRDRLVFPTYRGSDVVGLIGRRNCTKDEPEYGDPTGRHSTTAPGSVVRLKTPPIPEPAGRARRPAGNPLKRRSGARGGTPARSFRPGRSDRS
jgi:hypothetical protein